MEVSPASSTSVFYHFVLLILWQKNPHVCWQDYMFHHFSVSLNHSADGTKVPILSGARIVASEVLSSALWQPTMSTRSCHLPAPAICSQRLRLETQRGSDGFLVNCHESIWESMLTFPCVHKNDCKSSQSPIARAIKYCKQGTMRSTE